MPQLHALQNTSSTPLTMSVRGAYKLLCMKLAEKWIRFGSCSALLMSSFKESLNARDKVAEQESDLNHEDLQSQAVWPGYQSRYLKSI